MKHNFIILTFLFGLGIFSCQHKKIEDNNTKLLDSLITVAFVDMNYVLALDTVKMEVMKPVYDEFFEYFTRDNFDSENPDLYFNELSELAQCRKYLGRIIGKVAMWRELTELNHKQLVNLREDYSNGLMTEEEFNLALGEEWPALEKTHKQIAKNVIGFVNCQDRFDALTTRLDSIRLEYLMRHE